MREIEIWDGRSTHPPFGFAKFFMTTQMQLNDLWSLYAQAVVRFDYYACEQYFEPYQIVSFKRDGIPNPSRFYFALMLMECV
jgi:hypothetical protein